jgi:hypothetical protein
MMDKPFRLKRQESIEILIRAVTLATLSVAPAVAKTNPAELDRQTLEQRAVTAAIWGMPIVSMNAMLTFAKTPS